MSGLSPRDARGMPALRHEQARAQFDLLLSGTEGFLKSLGRWTCGAAQMIIAAHDERDRWRERYAPGGWKRGSGIRGVHIPVRSPLVVDVQSMVVRERATGGWVRARRQSAQLELAGTIRSSRTGMSRLTDNTINTYGGVASPWIQSGIRRSTNDNVGRDGRVYDNAYEQRVDYANVYVGRLLAGQLLSHVVELAAQARGVALPVERPTDAEGIVSEWIRVTGARGVANEYLSRLQEYYLTPEASPPPPQAQLPGGRPALPM